MFTGCTYKVTTARAGIVTMTEREIIRRYGSSVWDVHGDAIDHDEFCQNPKHKDERKIVLPFDLWGNPADIEPPF